MMKNSIRNSCNAIVFFSHFYLIFQFLFLFFFLFFFKGQWVFSALASSPVHNCLLTTVVLYLLTVANKDWLIDWLIDDETSDNDERNDEV